jgi:hypothetical protein
MNEEPTIPLRLLATLAERLVRSLPASTPR